MALPKKRRLKKKSEFDLVFKGGSIIRGNLLSLRYVKNRDTKSRFGFIVPAKIFKSSVARNKIKRTIAETIRPVINSLDGYYDIVISVNKRVGSMDDLRNELDKLIKEL